MENETRRPAGVDPAVLMEGVNDELDRYADLLEAEARAIGQRAAHKILTRDRWSLERLAETIEAEVRSTWGTPAEGDVIVRLRYAEGVQALAAIAEAIAGDRSETESQILGDARRKFLLAIGLG